MHFTDRTDAGRQLAARLDHLRGAPVVVVALPRGGVPVGAEVAEALGAPLDICVIRKLGVPSQPELGMGAIGEDGARVINEQVVRMAGVSPAQSAEVERLERAELRRRVERYRGGRAAVDLRGRTVVVVDDGVATGSTARTACDIVRARGAGRVVLAVPVAPRDWISRLGDAADELVCVAMPSPFFAIGEFYQDFTQTEDAEVLRCLARFAGREAAAAGSAGPAATGSGGTAPEAVDREVTVPVDGGRLGGRLTVPAGAAGVVVFAHGSGSSRHSPRNRFVAEVLNRAGLATLLFDLLTEAEEPDRHKVFDVRLLGGRLAAVTDRLVGGHWAPGLPVGYFGASTGAAAALWAAAQDGARAGAVVSRGGRPDLAGSWLGRVEAPTLLIVGGRDQVVIELNEQARERLRCPSELAVVPHATHLFEEPGTLEAAAGLARDWFLRYLAPPPGPGADGP
ncbi:phosphoribosyltransferase family protein [Kitasatospora sp. NPDC057015]|uniref:phosphoribosyltransferase family protein n=1 Tax=Kitasatospora sp. NPDC057015 TaxID=3346001 RepID=UPI003629232D